MNSKNNSLEPENIRITHVITGAYSKNNPTFSYMDDKYVKATSMYSMEEIHKIAKCSPLMMKEIHDEHMFELRQWKLQQRQAHQLKSQVTETQVTETQVTETQVIEKHVIEKHVIEEPAIETQSTETQSTEEHVTER